MSTLIPCACRVTAPFVSLVALFLTGCASYATPGRGADMRTFGMTADQQSDASIVKTMSKQPLATLPTSIAIVRVQAPGYRSQTAEGWGRGAYSIVTTRDIEKGDETLSRLQKLPMVAGVAPVNRLLLPEEFHSDLELRQAAAALHADMVLIYTLDTTFDVQDAAVPLSVVTLGLSPNEVAHVICTASAVIMDTRNGYVYGIAEATEKQSQLASAWTSEAAVDQTRKRVESKAFGMLIGNIGQTWNGVIRQLDTPRQATAE